MDNEGSQKPQSEAVCKPDFLCKYFILWCHSDFGRHLNQWRNHACRSQCSVPVFWNRWKGNAKLTKGMKTMLRVCCQEIFSNENRSNSALLIFVVNFNNCLCTFMLILLRNLQWKGKKNSFLCKRKNVMLICSIKYFLSINSLNLGFSVELIKLVVIEYVHYVCRSSTIQERSI